MPSQRDDEKLLEKYKAIWSKIEETENIELSPLPVYNERHVKTKKNNIWR